MRITSVRSPKRKKFKPFSFPLTPPIAAKATPTDHPLAGKKTATTDETGAAVNMNAKNAGPTTGVPPFNGRY